MRLGIFTATYLDMELPDVLKMAADIGYEAVELPAFKGNPHVDVEEIVKGNNAKELKKMVEDHGMIISALSNHPEGQIILGPYGKDTDAICPGTKEEKYTFGMERLIKTAQAANALEVPVVNGFMGCENFGRFFPWPNPKGWSDMEKEFVERWGKVLDKFGEYGIKFAHEPHPSELVYDIDTALRSVELMDGRKEWGFNYDPANLVYLGIDVERFIDELADRIYHVHAKDGELVTHNQRRSGCIPQGDWQRLGRGFRFRIPGWGSVPWKKVLTELSLIGYNYVMSYEHEDVTMSRKDGIHKTYNYLKPLIIDEPYEGRNDVLFQ
ncbi:MAG: sugar phosphate isomerase/epimerase [Spirochaetales bacterium]|nr:sugar phosphate isomerase/epimerase [Spirochaetales bacterium]MCF7937496.1 sugar phosphate isomerase/epimerase [Spirochaetales bacterium]